MAKQRYSGVLGLVQVDSAPPAATTFFSVGLCRSIQPPPNLRSPVDVTGLEDPAYVGLPGIPEQSNFEFEHVWDPNNSLTPADGEADQLLDNYWAAATLVTWKIVFNNGLQICTGTFTGRVLNLEPQNVDGQTGLTRTCTVITASTVAWVETAVGGP